MNNSKSLTISNDFSFLFKMKRNFELILDNKSYFIHEILLINFSIYFKELYLCDSSIKKLIIPISDPNNLFELIIDYIYGKDFFLTKENVPFIYEISFYFQNNELINKSSIFLGEILNKSIILLKNYENQPFNFYLPEINYISNHFKEIYEEKFFYNLPILIVDEIFRNIIEKIDSNFLVDIIFKFIEIRGNDFIILLSHLHFDQLSTNNIFSVKSLISSDYISGSLWNSICKRLSKNISKKSLKNGILNVFYQ